MSNVPPAPPSPKPKPTHAELWGELVDEAGETQIEQAAGVSVEQAEKELAEAGFDAEEERAKAEALLAELEGGLPPGDPKNGPGEKR